MILHKDNSVCMAGLRPEMDKAKGIINDYYAKYDLDLWITAGTEEFDHLGRLIHKIGSYHPRGLALDIRRSEIPKGIVNKFIVGLRKVLEAESKAYQLIIHKTHFHVEYDLKIAWRLEHGITELYD